MDDDGFTPVHQDLVRHLREVPGHTRPHQRHTALAMSGVEPASLAALTGKVALAPTTVTDRDLGVVLDAGFTEDQLFELVVCAAVGQAARQYEAGLDALAKAERTGR